MNFHGWVMVIHIEDARRMLQRLGGRAVAGTRHSLRRVVRGDRRCVRRLRRSDHLVRPLVEIAKTQKKEGSVNSVMPANAMRGCYPWAVPAALATNFAAGRMTLWSNADASARHLDERLADANARSSTQSGDSAFATYA
jgi:hypothetical protein